MEQQKNTNTTHSIDYLVCFHSIEEMGSIIPTEPRMGDKY